MPVRKPPFPLSPRLVDFGNWRLGGCQIAAWWPYNVAQTHAAGASHGPEEVAKGIAANSTSGVTAAVAPDANQRDGRCTLTSGNGTSSYTGPAEWQPALPIAALARIYPTSLAAVFVIWTNDGLGLNNWRGAFFYVDTAGKLICGFGDNTSNNNVTARRIKTGTTALTTNQAYDVACVIRGATDMSLYVNGVDDGGAYTGSGGAISYPSATFAMQALAGITGSGFSGSVDYVMQLGPVAGDSDIPQQVIQNVQADPWDLVTRRSSLMAWATLSGAGPHTPGVLTRLALDAYGAKRAGSFAGKTSSSGGGAHPVGRLTRFLLDAYGGKRAGSFANKNQIIPPVPTPVATVSYLKLPRIIRREVRWRPDSRMRFGDHR